jgi:proteasome alpha subunit
MGGSTERVETYLNDHYREELDLDAAVRLGVIALGHDNEVARSIPAEEVEAAVLDRSRNQQRKFRRLSVADVQRALDSGEPEPESSTTPDAGADGDNDAAADAADGDETSE